jgi:hypothetical protein
MWWNQKEEERILSKTTIRLIKETRFLNTGSLNGFGELTRYCVRKVEYWKLGSSNWESERELNLESLSEEDAKKSFDYLIKNNGDLTNEIIINEIEIPLKSIN